MPMPGARPRKSQIEPMNRPSKSRARAQSYSDFYRGSEVSDKPDMSLNISFAPGGRSKATLLKELNEDDDPRLAAIKRRLKKVRKK